jgi:hypothetical protein
MTWRTFLGLNPTPTDLALDLIKAAERRGLSGWQLFSVGRAVRAPALARHRRVRGVTLTRLPDSVRFHILWKGVRDSLTNYII